MGHQEASMGLAFILAAVLWAGTHAQSNECTTVLVSMSPCLNYITGNSSSPSPGCCTQLSTVVQSQPQCLCQVLNGGGSILGLSINRTQALALPRACNVQTPSTSQCNNAASPTGSPGSTPGNHPNRNSGGGSNTDPTNDGGSTSDANSTGLGTSLLFSIVFFVASYVVSTSIMI